MVVKVIVIFVVQLLSEIDVSCDSSNSDCECHSSESNSLTEFEVRSSSSSYHIDSNISDSSTTLEFKVYLNLFIIHYYKDRWVAYCFERFEKFRVDSLKSKLNLWLSKK